MRMKQLVGVGMALAVALSCAAAPAWADRDDRGGDRRGGAQGGAQGGAPRGAPPPRDGFRRNGAPPPPRPGYVYDNRYQHNRYYPPHGYVAPSLPRGYHSVPYRGTNYYYHGGVWYRPYGPRFVVVLPPVGLYVPVLPPFYTTIWVGSVPYYYADGVYYAWRPEQRVYAVVDPPSESAVSQPPEQLFVYPQKGQSEEKQATDRYQCHRWSADQTGFDPTQPGGNVPEAQHAAKSSDYQRAMKACLEARGYSVQ